MVLFGIGFMTGWIVGPLAFLLVEWLLNRRLGEHLKKIDVDRPRS